jgi:small basic protein (TIGR04137 family)
MSIHKSLKQKDTLVRNRSVLTRWERILKLKDIGRWSDGGKVTGLPKVRVKWKVRKKKKEAAAPVAGAAAPVAGAAAPAAAGKAAAPAAAGKAAAPAAAGKAAAPAAAGKAAAPAAGKKK